MNNIFQQRSSSALMHPVTLGALGVLLLNDLLLKTIWPGAWAPGKLSDLAWMVFAPPVLAYVLSWLTLRRPLAERAAFLAAYVGLPLLYAAFNTLASVHDAILRMLGLIGGDGPRSPLDPTDSLVIPLAMAAGLWVWRRQPLDAASLRARLALLAVAVAALASVASSYEAHWGITKLGRTDSGTLGAVAFPPHRDSDGTYRGYESVDGGLTWTERNIDVPLERQAWKDWDEREVREPSGAYFKVYRPPHIVRMRQGSNIQEIVYSYEYLENGGNRWTQAVGKRDIESPAITTYPQDLFYDDQSGNLIVAMGLEGVVAIAPDGEFWRVAVGPYSPTDFSFGGKVHTFFASLPHRETLEFTRFALLLTFSFATLALASSTASGGPRFCFILSAAISAFIGMTWGIYPYVPQGGDQFMFVGSVARAFAGFGALPLLLSVGGMACARTGRRRLLAIAAASVGLLSLVLVGALVLFEAGPRIANFVGVGLVGLGSLGLWAYAKRREAGRPDRP